MTWHFRKPSPGETTRDPIVGEFFATDAISGAAEALVREGIQNALDASVGAAVHVRILLASDPFALAAENAAPWFEAAWKHYYAKGNGLRQVPAPADDCKFLVFEDFGTTGLRGDVEQPFDEPGNKNSFYYFFRAEGRTGKSDGDRGRWGVGKHVFPRASRINTVFGLTVRSDDGQRMMMGHAVLKSHKIGSDHYSPDGHFGIRPGLLVLPLVKPSLLKRFIADFRIKRTIEPGLSLVVPYVDEEITYADLVRAIVDGYFYPILRGQITVEVEAPGHHSLINSQSLIAVAIGIGGQGENERLARVELAEWAANCKSADFVNLHPCVEYRPTWSDDLIPIEFVSQLRNKLLHGQKIALRAHVTVRPKGGVPQKTHFDMFLWEREEDDGRPIFIREGLTITDVRGSRARSLLSILVVEDKALATLLGDSENPAHTQWQRDSSNFRNKYAYGPAHIDFVRFAVARVAGVLRQSSDEHDVSTLADIFPRPIDDRDAPAGPAKPIPHSEKTEKEDKRKIVGKPSGYRLQRVAGGFSILGGHKDAPIPTSLKIRIAYDIRQGNPLKKYHEADFRLDRAPIKITKQIGIELRECVGNELQIDVLQRDFNLTIAGFDENRDLYVNVRTVERENASTV